MSRPRRITVRSQGPCSQALLGCRSTLLVQLLRAIPSRSRRQWSRSGTCAALRILPQSLTGRHLLSRTSACGGPEKSGIQNPTSGRGDAVSCWVPVNGAGVHSIDSAPCVVPPVLVDPWGHGVAVSSSTPPTPGASGPSERFWSRRPGRTRRSLLAGPSLVLDSSLALIDSCRRSGNSSRHSLDSMLTSHFQMVPAYLGASILFCSSLSSS